MLALLPPAPPQDDGHCGFVAERAELLLRQASQYGLHTRAQCVEYLGNLFRTALDAPARRTDHQVRAQAQLAAFERTWRGKCLTALLLLLLLLL